MNLAAWRQHVHRLGFVSIAGRDDHTINPASAGLNHVSPTTLTMAMSVLGRCCRKTILLIRAGKIDSRSGIDAQR
jgi:hypothetical protein